MQASVPRMSLSIVFGIADDGQPGIRAGGAERSLAADHDEPVEPVDLQRLADLLDAALDAVRLDSARAQDRAAARQESADVLDRELLGEALDHAAPSVAEPDEVHPELAVAVADRRADRRVQPGTVAAAGQDAEPHRANPTRWTGLGRVVGEARRPQVLETCGGTSGRPIHRVGTRVGWVRPRTLRSRRDVHPRRAPAGGPRHPRTRVPGAAAAPARPRRLFGSTCSLSSSATPAGRSAASRRSGRSRSRPRAAAPATPAARSAITARPPRCSTKSTRGLDLRTHRARPELPLLQQAPRLSDGEDVDVLGHERTVTALDLGDVGQHQQDRGLALLRQDRRGEVLVDDPLACRPDAALTRSRAHRRPRRRSRSHPRRSAGATTGASTIEYGLGLGTTRRQPPCGSAFITQPRCSSSSARLRLGEVRPDVLRRACGTRGRSHGRG